MPVDSGICRNQDGFTAFSSSSKRSTVSAGLAIQAVVEARRAYKQDRELSGITEAQMHQLTHLEVVRTSRQELITNVKGLGWVDATKVPLTDTDTPRFVADVDEDIVSTYHLWSARIGAW